MKEILFVILTTTLVGCFNEPQSIELAGKDNKFEVEYLFEKDGIKMYRFMDGSHYHYFTTNGETIGTQTSGKTTYEERIKTKYNMSDEDFHELTGDVHKKPLSKF
jgi:ABC-type ATPase with predicted acetyltransferase domain